MIQYQKLPRISSFQIDNSIMAFPPEVENRVTEIWNNALKESKNRLRDELVLSFQGIQNGTILVQPFNYRYYYAQTCFPDLHPLLNLDILAVSGLLVCKNGIVFGYRSSKVLQNSKMFELVPSGSLEFSTVKIFPNTPEEQLLIELHEEIGIVREQLDSIELSGYVYDDKYRVVDLCFTLTTDLDRSSIIRIWTSISNTEYNYLLIVPKVLIKLFIFICGFKVVPISRRLIKQIS